MKILELKVFKSIKLYLSKHIIIKFYNNEAKKNILFARCKTKNFKRKFYYISKNIKISLLLIRC